VLKHPLGAAEAVKVVQIYRNHPRWRLIGFPSESRPMHDLHWQKAGHRTFAFRRLYDARCALTMLAQGVTEFARSMSRISRSLALDGFSIPFIEVGSVTATVRAAGSGSMLDW